MLLVYSRSASPLGTLYLCLKIYYIKKYENDKNYKQRQKEGAWRYKSFFQYTQT